MCWACLNADHLNLPISAVQSTVSALQQVTNSKALLATVDMPTASWSSPLPSHKGPVIVSYSFLESNELPGVWSGDFSVESYRAFSEEQRGNFRKALAEFSDVCGIVFVETSGKAMIEVYGATGSDYGGWANFPDSSSEATGDVDLVIDGSGRFAPGSYEYFASIHEIGHAVGLKHPFEGSIQLTDAMDSTRNTVMSYTLDNTPTSLAALDIAALRTLYGAPVDSDGWAMRFEGAQFTAKGGARADWMTGVSFRSNQISGLGGNDTLFGREGADHLLGGTGNDRLSGLGGADRLEGGSGNDILNGSGGSEPEMALSADSLFGGDGSDRLYGGSSALFLQGGKGNDRLIGSADDAKLQGNDGADVIMTTGNSATLSGGGGSDRLTLNGSSGTIYGGTGRDTLLGGRAGTGWPEEFGGQDSLVGGSGYDYIYGRSSDDFLYAGADGGELHGGFGRDYLYGGSGVAVLYGDDGGDAIFANRSRATAYGGRGDDLLVGGAESGVAGIGATLYGGSGNDTLKAGSLSDRLQGGDGDDLLYGAPGAEVSTGSGADTLVFIPHFDVTPITILDFDPTRDRVVIHRLSYSETLEPVVFTAMANGTLATITEQGGFESTRLLFAGLSVAQASVAMISGLMGDWGT